MKDSVKYSAVMRSAGGRMEDSHPRRFMARSRRYIFFDLGETLIELQGLVVSLTEVLRGRVPDLRREAKDLAREWAIRAASRLPKSQGPDFDTEHHIGSVVLQELLKADGVSVRLKDAVGMIENTMELSVDRVRLYPDVDTEWLDRVRGLTAGMGVVTDGDAQFVPRVLDRLGIRRFFDNVTTSEDARAYKPDSLIYYVALEAMGADASMSLFVSDSALDLQGAAALGMGTVQIVRQFLPHEPAVPAGCVRLGTLRELDKVVSGYPGATLSDRRP